MDKEKIAKALYENMSNYVAWDKEYPHIQERYRSAAEAVIEALEADVTKECILSDEEIYDLFTPDLTERGWVKTIAKAQLAKVAPYIEAQVKAERAKVIEECFQNFDEMQAQWENKTGGE